jgi:hypothetical protein
MVSFIITPCISAIMAYVFSFLDIKYRGERARMPIIPLPFDKSDLEVTDMHENTEEDYEEGYEVDYDEDVVEHDGSVYASDFDGNTTVFDQSTAIPEHAEQAINRVEGYELDYEEDVVENDGSVYASDFEGNSTVFDQSTAIPEHAEQAMERVNIPVPAQY